MIVPVRLYGDACLKEEAFDVEIEKGDKVYDLVKDLFDTLKGSGTGVGLASTQIGVPLRVFVLSYDGFTSEFINPEILESSKEKTKEEEGCLSIPDVGVEVERSDSITVKYYILGEDNDLVEKTEKFDGYVSRIIQHEIDHLDGICITDKLGSLSKKLLKSKLERIVKGNIVYRYPTLHKRHKNYEKISQDFEERYLGEE